MSSVKDWRLQGAYCMESKPKIQSCEISDFSPVSSPIHGLRNCVSWVRQYIMAMCLPQFALIVMPTIRCDYFPHNWSRWCPPMCRACPKTGLTTLSISCKIHHGCWCTKSRMSLVFLWCLTRVTMVYMDVSHLLLDVHMVFNDILSNCMSQVTYALTLCMNMSSCITWSIGVLAVHFCASRITCWCNTLCSLYFLIDGY